MNKWIAIVVATSLASVCMAQTKPTTKMEKPVVAIQGSSNHVVHEFLHSKPSQEQTAQEPLTNNDIIQLVTAKVSTDEIVTRIKSSRCHFDTNPTVLVELKYRGVPEAVLNAMVQAPYGAPVRVESVKAEAKDNQNDREPKDAPSPAVSKGDRDELSTDTQLTVAQPTESIPVVPSLDSRTQSSTASAASTDNTASSTVDVRGYFRKDGTYVGAHKRTSPDSKFDNNWSTVGNVNPSTGKPGTKSWWSRNWGWFAVIGGLGVAGYFGAKHDWWRGTDSGSIVCNDGTISHAQHRQGACSYHGGIR